MAAEEGEGGSVGFYGYGGLNRRIDGGYSFLMEDRLILAFLIEDWHILVFLICRDTRN